MTLDQLSNLIKDPKLFGILIVRPFGLLLQWYATLCMLCIIISILKRESLVIVYRVSY